MAGPPSLNHAALVLTTADPNDEDAVRAAIDLGNRSKATLGLLPEQAYQEAAASGTLLLARLGTQVIGYALYALARGRVRLTHLCVDVDRRRSGVARALVARISASHADYAGVLARSRRDYGLGPMWIALGFRQLSEGQGRSRAGHLIVNWWLDHGHPNVFTRPIDTVLVRASIDVNILRDLAEQARPDASEALALLADQLSDRLVLVGTPALANEINDMEGSLRGRCTDRAALLPHVAPPADEVAALRATLLEAVQVAHREYPRDHQDEMDLRHVAESVAAGLNVFVTRDERLGDVLGPVAQVLYGLRILRPADVIVHIDELVRAEAYRPLALQDTAYALQRVGSDLSRQMSALANTRSGEKPSEFQRRLRHLALADHDRVGIREPGGRLVAGYVTNIAGGVLNIPVLRVADGPWADTMSRHLLFLLRRQARDVGAAVVRIADPYLSHSLTVAANDDGFVSDGSDLYIFVLAAADGADAIEHLAVIAARSVGLPAPAPMKAGMAAMVAAEIESRWWPAKLIDSKLPSYLVSIHQQFSQELLGVPTGLFPRADALGLSREHVYYRSVAGTRPSVPARLLWYMSGSAGRGVHPPGVIACSLLDDVVVGSASELHSRFRHLGVWNIDQIRSTARDGLVQALRFTNTEVFARPIGLKRLRSLGVAHGEHSVPQSPLKISSALFADLYRAGRDDG